MEIMIFSFHRATSDLLSDLQKRVFQAFIALWADGRIRVIPIYAFDIYLSKAIFYVLAMRLGRQAFEGDKACLRYL